MGIIFITWILRFPWTWFLYSIIALEIIVAIVVFAIDLDSRKTPGNGGWMMMFAAVFQIYLGVLLIFVRLMVLVKQYFKNR